MAKTSKIQKNEKRKVLVARHAARRAELKAIIRSPKTSDADRDDAFRALRKMPRDSSATRVRNRCSITGRPRGFVAHFGLSRNMFRDMALNGLIPGVRKASW